MVEDNGRAYIPYQASYPGSNRREPICPPTLPSGPWSEIAVDFAGPFPSGQYLFVAVDEYSRYPEEKFVYSTSANNVIPWLKLIIARQGFQTSVKSDNGSPFQGQDFADFAVSCGVFMYRRSTPLWPESNGGVERFRATLNKSVRASVAGNHDWKAEPNSFLMHYRATTHCTTRISLFEALTGRKMNTEFPDIPDLPQTEPIPVSARMS